MKILLVGGSGFIGRHLLRALHGDGHSIIATRRNLGRPAGLGLNGGRWILGYWRSTQHILSSLRTSTW